MRIHEILEACVEYVAIDGVLGSDIQVLLRHLQSRDASIDEDYFAHIWPSLVSHASIQLILTRYPLPSPFGPAELGTAPLPADYDPTKPFGGADKDAVKDVQDQAAVAAGYTEDGQAEAGPTGAQKGKKKAVPKKQAGAKGSGTGGDPLLIFLNDNDGGKGAEKVPLTDLAAMRAKWGSRFRIRATDQEIYYRLTGSHETISKVTALVFHTLQLSARNRERGMTTLELTPSVRTSPTSMFHYMKTLVGMGLCVKVPYVANGSTTNILLFYKFIEQNALYQAILRENTLRTTVIQPEASIEDAVKADDEADADANDDTDVAGAPDEAWGLNFTPLTPEDIFTGHLVRERLVTLLDHPNLKNHLLRRRNLLPLLGWNGEVVYKFKRALLKHIEHLRHQGIVEVVEVENSAVRCLRLTKYNPDFANVASALQQPVQVHDDNLHMLDDATLASMNAEPYSHSGGAILTQPMDFQVNDLIAQSGVEGVTIKDIRRQLNYFYKRTIEFHFKRSEASWVPPQLRDREFTHNMDSFGRERRLKALSVDSYRAYMAQHGLAVDDEQFPPLTDEVGRWQPLDNRLLWSQPNEFQETLSHYRDNYEELSEFKERKAPAKSAKSKKNSQARPDPEEGGDPTEGADEERPKKKRKTMGNKYDNASQTRGRPRKYVHVVDMEGKVVTRNTIRQVPNREGLPEVWIWVTHKDKGKDRLVPSPEGYDGLGKPPPIPAAVVKEEGKTINWFKQFGVTPMVSGKGKKKDTAADKPTKGTGSGETAKKGKGKKTAKAAEENGGVVENDGPADSAASGDQAGPSRQTNADKIAIDSQQSGQVVTPIDNDNTQSSPSRTSLTETAAAAATKESSALMNSEADQQEERPTAGSAQEPPPRNQDHQSTVARIGATQEPARPTWITSASDAGPTLPAVTPPHSLEQEVDQLDPDDTPTVQCTAQDTELSAPLFGKKRNHPLYAATTGSSSDGNGPLLPANGANSAPAATEPSNQLAEQDGRLSDSATATPRHASQSLEKKQKPDRTASTRQSRNLPPKTWEERKAAKAAKESMPPEFFKLWQDKERLRRIAAAEEAERVVAARMPTAQPNSDEPKPSDAVGSSSTGPVNPAMTEGVVTARDTPSMDADQTKDAGNSSAVSASANTEHPLPLDTATVPAVARPRKRPGKSATPQIVAANDSSPAMPTASSRLARPIPDFDAASIKIENDKAAPRAKSRVDMGEVRRMNELIEALKDVGGVTEVGELFKYHYVWSKKVVGTNAPHAPVKAVQMDRTVYKKTMDRLERDKRLKRTTTVLPSAVGRDARCNLTYLPDIDSAAIRRYAMQLGQMTNSLLGQKRKLAKVQTQDYTEVVLPKDSAVDGLKATRERIKGGPRRSAVDEVDGDDATLEARRATLLRDQVVVPALYGYHSGKIARAETMHKAVIEALRPDVSTILSTTPAILATEFLFSQITVSDWYKAITSIDYSEDLVNFVNDPNTSRTRLIDVPEEIRLRKYWGGHANKTKLYTILDTLSELRLIRPLTLVGDHEEAELSIVDNAGTTLGFNTRSSVIDTAFIQLYDVAPIYHINQEATNLLGVVPIKTPQQTASYWRILKEACFRQSPNAIPTMDRTVAATSLHAPYTESFETQSVTLLGMLRQRRRWSKDPRLLDVQVQAINDLVEENKKTILDDEDRLKGFAYEWCVQLGVLRDHIAKKLGKMADEEEVMHVRRGGNRAVEKAANEARRRKAEEQFNNKLQEIRTAGQKEWTARVEAAAQRTGMSYTPELDKYLAGISYHALQKNGSITDDALDAGCQAFVRQQSLGMIFDAPPDGPNKKSAGLFRRVTKKVAKPPKVKKVQHRPLTRRRRRWTEEDDTNLLYAEAIIRARHRNKPGNPGRDAILVQILPDTGRQPVLNRLKKLWELPGRLAFFERLMDGYYDNWVKDRGTDALPDPDPSSVIDFDLPKHIEYLKQKIPSEIRFSDADELMLSNIKTEDLPTEHAALLDSRTWEYLSTPSLSWNAAFDVSGDDYRSSALNRLSLRWDEAPPVAPGTSDAQHGKLKALIKMINSCPTEEYHPTAGEALIKPYSNKAINDANSSLVAEKIVRKWRNASSGRMYQINGSWYANAEGPYPEGLFSEAEQLHKRFESATDEDGGVEWPLMGSSGEMASLLNMVSNHQVDFDFDLTKLTVCNELETYNTRSLNDKDFEFEINVKRTTPLSAKPTPSAPSIYSASTPRLWPIEEMPLEELVTEICNKIRHAGENGISKPELKAQLDINDQDFTATMGSLAERDVFWAGYDTARLVHQAFWPCWAVHAKPAIRNQRGEVIDVAVIQEVGGKWALPRRWTDPYGEWIEEEWARAKRLVLGTIVARPGLTERGLRNRIGTNLDRLEVNDVLQFLLDARDIKRESLAKGGVVPPVEATDVEEEEGIILVPNSLILWN